MKIVVAPDSFKGSLTAKKMCDITEEVSKSLFDEVEVVKIPMADGGEGTVESVIDALNGTHIEVQVKNPLGNPVTACYGMFEEKKAIMEMASASGITLVDDSERDILKQNTYGTGEMILDAIERGAETIYIGIGGSATNDGGMGFASAIGVKFLDSTGNEVEPIPEKFTQIVEIDDTDVDSRIKDTTIIIMSDVTNPLLGTKGATHVFGRQKGADDGNLITLEEGMESYINIVEEKTKKSVQNIEGAGAAGGLGAGLLAFTNAQMKSGVTAIMEIVALEEQVKDADLVITGEGMMDYQSAYGKVASGVGKTSFKYGVPCIAIVGAMGEEAEAMYECGITSIITTVNGIMSLDDAINNADQLFTSAVRRALRIVRI